MPDATKLNQYTGQLSATGLVPDAHYSRALLKMLMNEDFVFLNYGEAHSQPKNSGKTMNFRRYDKIVPVSTPLTEGVPPELKKVSGASITAVLKQYGDAMGFTDLAEDMLLDDLKAEYTYAFGVQANESLDNIVKTELETAGSPMFVNGTSYATIDVSDGKAKPNIDMIRKAGLMMSNNHIKKHKKGGGNYVVLIDEACMFDLFDDPRVEKYMQFGMTNKPMVANWVVDMFGLRFIKNMNPSTSSQTLADSKAHTTHNIYVLGNEAYGTVKLGGEGVKFYSKGLGSAGTADPIDQQLTIGWKIMGFVAKVLTPLAVQKLIVVPTNE